MRTVVRAAVGRGVGQSRHRRRARGGGGGRRVRGGGGGCRGGGGGGGGGGTVGIGRDTRRRVASSRRVVDADAQRGRLRDGDGGGVNPRGDASASRYASIRARRSRRVVGVVRSRVGSFSGKRSRRSRRLDRTDHLRVPQRGPLGDDARRRRALAPGGVRGGERSRVGDVGGANGDATRGSSLARIRPRMRRLRVSLRARRAARGPARVDARDARRLARGDGETTKVPPSSVGRGRIVANRGRASGRITVEVGRTGRGAIAGGGVGVGTAPSVGIAPDPDPSVRGQDEDPRARGARGGKRRRDRRDGDGNWARVRGGGSAAAEAESSRRQREDARGTRNGG